MIGIPRLPKALVDDFYAPIPMGSLFTKVYPGEHFDIESSPLRIRQVLSRLRKWFSKNHITASVSQKETLYKMEIIAGLSFEISQTKSNSIDFNRNFERIRKHYTNKNPFTIKDVVHDLGISRSDFHRIMKWATEKQFVIKGGKGKTTHYRLASSSSQSLTVPKAS